MVGSFPGCCAHAAIHCHEIAAAVGIKHVNTIGGFWTAKPVAGRSAGGCESLSAGGEIRERKEPQ
jgi:hypothetical protein